MNDELVDQLGIGITGERYGSVPSDRTGLGLVLGAIKGLFRTAVAAAAALGVSATTFRRWLRGVQKPKVGLRTMVAVARRAMLPAAQEKAIRRKEKLLKIKGIVVVSDSVRPRTLDVGRHLPAHVTGRMLSAWLRGDDERAEKTLMRGIEKHYTEGLSFDSVERVWFE